MIRRKTTQEILGESIHELAKTKAVDKITVREIVGNCGLSSATFYRHFRDKHELIAWIFNYQMEYVFTDMHEGMETWKQAVFDTLSILDDDRAFYLNAVRHTEGPNSFLVSTRSRCGELLLDYIQKKLGAALPEETVFDAEFYMRGISYTVYEWFVDGKDQTVAQLTEHLCRVMPEGLKKFLMEGESPNVCG